MNKNFNKTSLLIAGLVCAALIAAPVFAQTTGTPTNTPSTSISTVISNADKEIDQRITSLNNLLTRIGSMKKITSTVQNTLTTSVQNEITELITLKAKIDADTSLPTAKTDYQSITKSYRIYALVLPQTTITAAADRVVRIVDSMNIVGGKIQSRISALTGTNVAPINQLFSDFSSKLSDASTQARAAANEVLKLIPDQGDKVKMQANTAALKDARTKIVAAKNDLVAARKDLTTIVQDLREIGAGAKGTNSATTPSTP